MAKTPRERILRSLDHREPSRIPIDLGSTPVTGITGEALYDLNDYLGIEETVRVHDTMQWLALPSEEVLEWIGADARGVFLNGAQLRPGEDTSKVFEEYLRPGGRKYLKLKEVEIALDDGGNEYMLNNEGEHMMKRSPKSHYFDDYPVDYTPLKDVDDIDSIEKVPQSPLHRDWSESDFETLEETAKWFNENTNFALVAHFGGSMFESPTHLRGYERFLMDIKRSPEFVRGLEEMLVEKYKRELEGFLDAVGDYVQIVELADDLGQQQGPLISPNDYRELIHPYMKEVYQFVKEKTDCYLMRHSCGAIRPFIEDFIDLGVDILNPVQISAKDMEPRELKDNFGDEIAFWGGGCDTQSVLPNASPRKIRNFVKEMCEIFAPGGGFVFNQVHNIQPDVPPKNIEAMYEGVREASKEVYG